MLTLRVWSEYRSPSPEKSHICWVESWCRDFLQNPVLVPSIAELFIPSSSAGTSGVHNTETWIQCLRISIVILEVLVRLEAQSVYMPHHGELLQAQCESWPWSCDLRSNLQLCWSERRIWPLLGFELGPLSWQTSATGAPTFDQSKLKNNYSIINAGHGNVLHTCRGGNLTTVPHAATYISSLLTHNLISEIIWYSKD